MSKRELEDCHPECAEWQLQKVKVELLGPAHGSGARLAFGKEMDKDWVSGCGEGEERDWDCKLEVRLNLNEEER